MRLLLINPNRSEWITQRIAAVARPMLRAGDALETVTSVNGPDAVRSLEQLSAAAQEVQSLAARNGDGYDALIVGISLDCGLFETRRQQGRQPVIGMTEAACHAACLAGERFGVLTVGAGMATAYEAHMERLGVASRCVGVAAPDCPQAFSAHAQSAAQIDPQVLDALMGGVQSLQARGADSVVLAGAVLCGYGAAVERAGAIPVWEGPACAVGMARTLLDHAQCAALAR